MQGIEVTYGTQTKAIYEDVENYDHLKELVMKYFYLEKSQLYDLAFENLDKEIITIEGSFDKKFESLYILHKNKPNNTVPMKFRVFHNLKDSCSSSNFNISSELTKSIPFNGIKDNENNTNEEPKLKYTYYAAGSLYLNDASFCTSVAHNLQNSNQPKEFKSFDIVKKEEIIEEDKAIDEKDKDKDNVQDLNHNQTSRRICLIL